MATLPSGGTELLQVTTVERQPSLSWRINKETGRIEGTVDGLAAVRQAVEVILNVARFRWQIYSPRSGTEWQGLVGQDPGYVAAELKRRVREALMMDDRVLGVPQFTYSAAGEKLAATLTVQTVYGDMDTAVEVEMG